jgi:hypothetical protein
MVYKIRIRKHHLAMVLVMTFYFFNISHAFAQWVQTTGVIGGNVNALMVKDPKIFAGTDTGGVFVSNDNGLNWSASNTGLDNHNIKAFCVKNNVLISGIGNGLSTGSIYLSNNNGGTWAPTSVINHEFLFCLANYNSDILAGTWYGVTKSSDAGSTWTGLPTTGLPSNATVTALACNLTTIYAGVLISSVGGSGVFASLNNGNSWVPKNNGLTNTEILSLAISPTRIFTGTNGGGVFVSSDNGSNWNAANTGLANLKINTLVIRGSKIFAGTDGGIYMSGDNGATWTNISTGLPANSKIFSITYKDPFMLVGTDVAVWRRPLADFTGLNDISYKDFNVTVSPNPNHGVFEIKMQNNIADAEISVTDALGRIVYDDRIRKDMTSLKLDLGACSKGIYSINIRTKEKIVCRKLCIQ